MTTHSKIGASSCERWWHCPGSVDVVSKLPPQPDSDYAREGTAAHELAERCLKEYRLSASGLVGQFAKNGVMWDDDMAEAVDIYTSTIIKDMAAHGCYKKDIQIENKFHLVHIDENAFGTNDANLQVFLKKLIVYDFKYGAGMPVEVEENKQMLYYGLGAAMEGDYPEVELVIIQPRAPHQDGPVRRWCTSGDRLKQFGADLRIAILNTRTKGAPLVAGNHCKKSFCPNMPTCPAFRSKIEQAAGVVFSEIESVTEVLLPQPEDLKFAELEMLLDIIPLIDAWIKSVEAHAFNMAQRGEKVKGYKLVRKRANRDWKDPDEVQAAFELEYGKEIFKSPKLKSPAQLETMVGKKEVAKYAIKPEGGLTLVPESDPREEVSASAIGVFETIDESNLKD